MVLILSLTFLLRFYQSKHLTLHKLNWVSQFLGCATFTTLGTLFRPCHLWLLIYILKTLWFHLIVQQYILTFDTLSLTNIFHKKILRISYPSWGFYRLFIIIHFLFTVNFWDPHKAVFKKGILGPSKIYFIMNFKIFLLIKRNAKFFAKTIFWKFKIYLFYVQHTKTRI